MTLAEQIAADFEDAALLGAASAAVRTFGNWAVERGDRGPVRGFTIRKALSDTGISNRANDLEKLATQWLREHRTVTPRPLVPSRRAELVILSVLTEPLRANDVQAATGYSKGAVRAALMRLQGHGLTVSRRIRLVPIKGGYGRFSEPNDPVGRHATVWMPSPAWARAEAA